MTERQIIEMMAAAIRTTQCPRPSNAVPEHIEDWLVVDCVACGDCGCDLGIALRAANGEQVINSGETK